MLSRKSNNVKHQNYMKIMHYSFNLRKKWKKKSLKNRAVIERRCISHLSYPCSIENSGFAIRKDADGPWRKIIVQSIERYCSIRP